MSQTVQLRRSAVAGKQPSTSQLGLGEIAINTADGKLFFKKDDGIESIVTILEVTEDNLSIDTSGYTQTTASTLADVLSDLDSSITSALAGGLTVVASDGTLSGNGTSGSPLSVVDNSHDHTIANVTGLQTVLDSKLATIDFNTTADTWFGTTDTDSLSEGSTNLYYTEERVDDRVAALLTGGTGINAVYDDDGNLLNLEIDFTEFDTDSITEGVVNTYLTSKTTDDLSEGSTNLYYTDSRARTAARTALSATGDISYNSLTGQFSVTTYKSTDFATDFATKDTDDLSEGSTNLYYTDARVGSYLTTNNYATETYVDTAVNNLIDAAPAALDTLNELAAALNDDPNFATTVTTTLASKLDSSSSIGELLDVDLSSVPTDGQVLTWNSSLGSFVAGGTSAGLTSIATDSTIDGDGTSGDPLSIQAAINTLREEAVAMAVALG